jgi:hypothetical protein
MKYWICQVRYGPNEFYVTLECNDIGNAILALGEYLYELDPTGVFSVTSVSQSECDIMLEDTILN